MNGTLGRRMLGIGCFFLSMVCWAQVQGQDQPAVQESVGSSLEVDMADWWRDYKAAKADDDKQTQERVFERFRDIQEKSSAEIFETAAYLFLNEGLAELERGNFENARREFWRAAELDPYLWTAYDGLARIKKEKDKNISHFLHLNLKGLRSALHLKNTYFFLGLIEWVILALFWVLVLTLVGFTIVLGLKYVKPFYVSTSASFEQHHWPSFYAKVGAMVMLLLPLLLGLNPFLAAGLYLVLFIPFFEALERKTVMIIFILWMFLPLPLWLMTNAREARADKALRANLSHFLDQDFESRIALLESLECDPGEDCDRNRMNIAHLQRLQGNYRDALDTYESISGISKHWPMVQVNKANIHYDAKEYQEAIELYNMALEAEPQNGLANYNLSRVLAKLGNHEEAERMRAIAVKDPQLSRRLDRMEVSEVGRVLDGFPSPLDRVYSAILRLKDRDGNPIIARSELYFPGLMGLVLLLLALAHLKFRNTRVLAKSCDKCGRIYFPSDSPNSEWCSQCVSLYIRKEDLPSDAKIMKQQEVKTHKRRRWWRGLLVQLVLPGGKRILRGETWGGLLTLGFWGFLLVMCVEPLNNLNHLSAQYLHSPLVLTFVFMGVAVVYWLIFGLRPIWQED